MMVCAYADVLQQLSDVTVYDGVCAYADVLQQFSDVTVYDDDACVRLTCCSSVSYIDDLVGDVLQKLEDLRLENDTVVMLMSDHGWHLSESSSVCARACVLRHP